MSVRVVALVFEYHLLLPACLWLVGLSPWHSVPQGIVQQQVLHGMKQMSVVRCFSL